MTAAPLTAAPLSAVDAVDAVPTGAGWRLTARKRVDAAEPYLHGHFPQLTIYPGVFLVESLYQAVRAALGGPDRPLRLAQVGSARFLAPLLPGQTLRLDATVEPAGDGALAVRARAVRDDDGARVGELRLLLTTGGDR